MLSILMLSHKGEGYGIKQRLENEGHLVKFWIEDPSARAEHETHTKGHTIDRYEKHLETTDLVLECSSRFGRLCEELRAGGKLVLGGRTQGLLEGDMAFEQATAKLLDLAPCHEQDGLNVVLVGQFGQGKFHARYYLHNYQRVLNGERGPQLPSAGVLAKCYDTCELSDKLVEFLAGSGYNGLLGISLNVSETNATFKNFITSLSHPVLSSMLEPQRNLGEYLYQLACGNPTPVCQDFVVGVVVTNVRHNKLKAGTPADKHVLPESPNSCLVTARGATPREARRRVYRTLTNIGNRDLIYRTDIGHSPLWED